VGLPLVNANVGIQLPGCESTFDYMRLMLSGARSELEVFGQEFCECLESLASVHGVSAFLVHRAIEMELVQDWPSSLVDRLHRKLRSAAVRELGARPELQELLAGFRSADIRAVLIKGAPLSYTHYPAPHLRERGDTDILVREGDRLRAHELLLELGYTSRAAWARHCGSYQLQYSAPLASVLAYDIDLHWRVNDRQVFADAVGFEELWGSAVPVPMLGLHAQAPKPVHALLIACVHRVHHLHVKYMVNGASYVEANRLIWLYDIHALCNRFVDEEWDEFVALALDRGVGSVCEDGLRAAHTYLGTLVDPSVYHILLSRRGKELSRKLLTTRGPESYRWVDLLALENWGDKMRLLTDWLWPTKDHMANKFNVPVERVNVLLYLRRAMIWGRRLFWNRLRQAVVKGRSE
jgi:hypothetical protein